MPIVLMHLLSYTSQTRTVRMCVCMRVYWSVCVCVCLLYSVCLPKSPPLHHHHRKHVLSPPTFIRNSICCFFPPLSLLFHFPGDPELTNTQTVSDVKQWTRRAFRPLTLTVEGIEWGRLWEGHASLNRQ